MKKNTKKLKLHGHFLQLRKFSNWDYWSWVSIRWCYTHTAVQMVNWKRSATALSLFIYRSNNVRHTHFLDLSLKDHAYQLALETLINHNLAFKRINKKYHSCHLRCSDSEYKELQTVTTWPTYRTRNVI